MMAAGMDDVLIFNRDLTAAEVAAIVPIRFATTGTMAPSNFMPSKTMLNS
jgi:hypothetical protein